MTDHGQPTCLPEPGKKYQRGREFIIVEESYGLFSCPGSDDLSHSKMPWYIGARYEPGCTSFPPTPKFERP